MNLRGRIIESVEPNDNSVIVIFEKDPEKQHFEIKCDFNPYSEKMQKWDIWDFKIKLVTEIFTDEKTDKKSYFTHLFCKKAVLHHELGSIPDKYK